MKILLIDDDEALSTILINVLTKEGFQVVTTGTGQEGISKAITETPNLILLDQVLPDFSGNEILKQLKLDEKTKNIPIIILSNFSQEELIKEAINLGAADYVFKYQVEPKDIVEKINNTLKQTQN